MTTTQKETSTQELAQILTSLMGPRGATFSGVEFERIHNELRSRDLETELENGDIAVWVWDYVSRPFQGDVTAYSEDDGYQVTSKTGRRLNCDRHELHLGQGDIELAIERQIEDLKRYREQIEEVE